MSLRDYSPPTKVVGDFTVHGLSLDDLSGLLQARRQEVEQAVLSFAAARERNEPLTDTLLGLLQEVPDITAMVIARGCGEPDSWPTAKLLPFPMAVQALETILELTFTGSGGPKKLGETLARLASGLGISLPALESPNSTSA
jgi:hypothetical protein